MIGPVPKKWTLLLYSAADNDMQKYNLRNVADLETVGSDQYTNLVAQVDTGAACNRYLVQKAATPDIDRVQSPVLESGGPVNMSDPRTLTDFVTWGVKNFPAEHYMVIVSDHGSGWQGAVQDDSHQGWMTLPQLREGLEAAQQQSGQKIDIVGFDACLMGSTEVAHELKDVCNFLVGSEDYEDSDGWPYPRIFNPELAARLQETQHTRVRLDPRALAIECVNDAAGRPEVLPTMSAVDCAQVQPLTDAFDALGQAIVDSDDTTVAALREAAHQALPFDEFRDAGDFLRRVAADTRVNADVHAAATDAIDALGNAVIAQQHAPQNAASSGLTIEVGTNGIREGYAETRFARETRWTDALRRLQTPPATQPQTPPAAQPPTPGLTV